MYCCQSYLKTLFWVHSKVFSLSDAGLGLIAECDAGSVPQTRYCPEVTPDIVSSPRSIYACLEILGLHTCEVSTRVQHFEDGVGSCSLSVIAFGDQAGAVIFY